METIQKPVTEIHRKHMSEMDITSKISIWFNRAIFVFMSFLFTRIGFSYMLHPIENAALSQITLGSADAISLVRVELGAVPLAFAVLAFTSLFSLNQIYRSILTIFVIMTIATTVRIFCYNIDGVAPHLVPEVIVTIISGIGLFLEVKRRKKYPY